MPDDRVTALVELGHRESAAERCADLEDDEYQAILKYRQIASRQRKTKSHAPFGARTPAGKARRAAIALLFARGHTERTIADLCGMPIHAVEAIIDDGGEKDLAGQRNPKIQRLASGLIHEALRGGDTQLALEVAKTRRGFLGNDAAANDLPPNMVFALQITVEGQPSADRALTAGSWPQIEEGTILGEARELAEEDQ